MSEKVVIGTQNFSGGLVTVQPAHLLEEGQTPSCQNVDFSESVGRLTKRKGFSVLQNANQGSSFFVSGVHSHIYENGTERFLAAVNDDVYKLTTPSTWTSIHTNASNNGQKVRFASFRLTAAATETSVIFVGPGLTTQKWTPDSASSSNLGGTPPSNANFICVHKNRLFIANHSATGGKYRVNYSAALNAEDWTTTNDAGSFDVDPGDGEITGMVSVGAYLLVFKKFATYVLRGNTPSQFVVQKISPNIGCVAHDTIIRADTFAIFLAHNGVYAATDTGVALLSYNIKPTLESLTDTAKAGAVAGKHNTQYWLCVDTDADGKNDTVYYLDYIFGIWGQYTNKNYNAFATRKDGSLIGGTSNTDRIDIQNDTNNDNGSAISMIWDSPDYDGGDWAKIKQVHDIITAVGPISAKTLTVSHLLNGVVQGTTLSQSLTPTGAEDKVYLRRRHFPDASYSPYIRFRFSNNETDALVKIFGYSSVLNVLERANG